jgi:hypothetical protein
LSTSAPYARPPAQHRRRGGVVVPLVLIFIGGIFLLQNTGYLPPNAWLNLWRLWPLILVLAGLELLLAQRVPWLVLTAIAALVLGLGVAVSTAGLPVPASRTAAATVSTPTSVGSATQATVTVHVGAGQLAIGPLVQPPGDQLAIMNYDGPSDLAPRPRYVVSGGIGQLEYELTGRGGPAFIPFVGGRAESSRMELDLNPNVPISLLTVQTGATDAHLDLSKLNVKGVELSVGAASTWMRLPEAAGTTSVHVSGGASSLLLEVPQGVAAQIRHRGGLSTINVDQSRFPSVGDGMYRSPDYDSAQNKVDLNLETGVTTIQVN